MMFLEKANRSFSRAWSLREERGGGIKEGARERKLMKLRCKFNYKRLNRIQRTGEGDRGRRPDRRTVFKDGTD